MRSYSQSSYPAANSCWRIILFSNVRSKKCSNSKKMNRGVSWGRTWTLIYHQLRLLRGAVFLKMLAYSPSMWPSISNRTNSTVKWSKRSSLAMKVCNKRTSHCVRDWISWKHSMTGKIVSWSKRNLWRLTVTCRCWLRFSCSETGRE